MPFSGDSIFDNGAYTSGLPDVVTHLRHLLPAGWTASLEAVDGAVVADLPAQLRRAPDAATHVVISIGGNDALRNTDLLGLQVDSSAEALQVFAERTAEFERSYRTAIRAALQLRRRTAVCTVYNGALDLDRARIARPALAMFNDVILRTAIDLRLDALELRSICTEAGDYANPIEPSGPGGLKIARASHIWSAPYRASHRPRGSGGCADTRQPPFTSALSAPHRNDVSAAVDTGGGARVSCGPSDHPDLS